MDFLTFLSKSEWQIVILIFLVLFRKRINSLINNLKLSKATIAGNTLEFKDEISQAESIASINRSSEEIKESSKNETIISKDKEKEECPLQENENLHWSKVKNWIFDNSIPDVPPEYIILKCWNEIEKVQNELTDYINNGFNNKKMHEPLPPRYMTKDTVEKNIKFLGMDIRNRNIIERLRSLRNKVAHGIDINITKTDALRYRDLTKEVIKDMKKEIENLYSMIE